VIIRKWLAATLGVLALALGSGCLAILGVGDEYTLGGGAAGAGAQAGSGGDTGGGGTGAAGATGGSGATGGGTGAMGATGGGGQGGSGGNAPTLVDRGLLVRYYIDEAASGQTPQQLIDAAPSPLNLTINYTPSLTFTEVASNRGLHWALLGSSANARTTLDGTKILSGLNGHTTGTIEAVVDVTAVGDGTRELPWLTIVLATLLVVPALARPAARMWAIVFVAALALWLGLWTLPALWPGQRWLGER